MTRTTTGSTVMPRLRPIALPAEHGGWGFTLEPVLLGLLIAPSLAGLLLGVAAVAAFSLDQPLRVALKDRLRQMDTPRTMWAERFVLLYGGIMLLAGLGAWSSATHPFWLPLIAGLPLAVWHFVGSFSRDRRTFAVELSGALAFAFLAPTIISATQGFTWPLLALWGVLAIRDVTSILYVRGILRQQRGEAVDRAAILAVHAGGVLLALVLAQWVGLGAVLAVALLMIRSVWGLTLRKRTLRASIVGFIEIGLGVLVAVLTAIW
jgi:hypothetical protein